MAFSLARSALRATSHSSRDTTFDGANMLMLISPLLSGRCHWLADPALLVGSQTKPRSARRLRLRQWRSPPRPNKMHTCCSSLARLVFVVALPPGARLIASFGGAIQPLVHTPEAVQATRIGGIAVVDGASLEHEAAHTWPLARIG